MTKPRSDVSKFAPRDGVVIISVGGSGAKATAEISKALLDMGHKFGEAIGERGAIVHALAIDSNKETFDDMSNPDTVALKEAGVNTILLHDPEQNVNIRKLNLDKVAPEGAFNAAKEDAGGCCAIPNIGRARYHVQRKSTEAGRNPAMEMRRIAQSFITLNEDVTLGSNVDVIFIFGSAGGTGPTAIEIAADANQIFNHVLARGAAKKQVTTRAFVLSSESSGFDPARAAEVAQEEARRLNCAITLMRMDEATVKGRVTMPDGDDTIEGLPMAYIHLLNGSNGDVAARKMYDPIEMSAKAVLARILQIGGVDAAESNVELGIPAPSIDFEEVPANWIGMGLAELLPNPSRHLLLLKKRQAALEAATGISTVDQAEVTRRLGQVGVSEIVNRAMMGVKLPTLDRADFGALDKVGVNTNKVLTEFKGELPGLVSALEVKVKEAVKEAWAAVKKFAELRAEKKLGTLVAASEGLSEGVTELITSLQDEMGRLRREVGSYKTNLDTAAAQLSQLKYDAWLPGKKKDQELAIRGGQDAMESAADRLAQATARLTAVEILLTEITRNGGFQANTEAARNYAQGLKGNVLRVRDSLAPGKTQRSPFDLEVEIDIPDLTVDAGSVDPKDFSEAALRTMLEELQLDPSEVNLRKALSDPHTVAKLRRHSEPLTIAPAASDTARKQTFREIILPVGENDTMKVNPDGTIRNAKNELGLENGSYTVRATEANGPTIMQSKIYGLSLLQDSYARGLIKDLIAQILKSPAACKEVEKRFAFKGQLEELVPVYAAALAEDEGEKDGWRGQTIEVEVPGKGFKVKLYKTEVQLAEEARRAKARAPRV